MRITKIHHLNCATLRLRSARVFDRQRSLLDGSLVCVAHCLLIETSSEGLVLVDSGFATEDVKNPRRVSPIFQFVFGPVWTHEQTVLAHLRALKLDPHDVRHIVLTHLDYDHANGLADFPWATAHVCAAEIHDVTEKRSLTNRLRYDQSRLRAHAQWDDHELIGGEKWFADLVLSPIKSLGEVFAFVPLRGHSAGHCGVAIRYEHKWLLDAGDAYMQQAELLPSPDGGRRTGFFQPVMQADGGARKDNLARLSQLRCNHSEEVAMFCAHDKEELELFQA